MNKQLLTEILDSVTAVHAFISADLSREPLSPDCNAKRQKFSQRLEELCNKIRTCQLSTRPRMNTPSRPDIEPPSPAPVPKILEMTEEEEEEGEMYTEFDPAVGAGEPEDYLAFEPSQTSADLSQETYEAMTEDDVYEEPRPGPQEEQPELYEEPSSSSGDRPSTASSLHPPTPSQSRENSASGSEFIEPTREHVQFDHSSVPSDISTDWNVIYSPPKKGDDSKVGSLKGVSIQGFLEKLGGRNKTSWQRRYCVMSGPLMYFYEKKSSKTYNNFVCVLNFTVSEQPSMTNEKKKQFAFKLSHQDTATGKKKDYCFRAVSSDTRDKWITAIQKVIQKPTSPPMIGGSPLGVSATLPRLSSGSSSSPVLVEPPKPRSMSMGEDEGEVYEDMAEPIKEESEEEEGDDYLPVSPVHENVEELTSSAEYVDVQPATENNLEEDYEDTTPYQTDQPPPPMTPPPGPPTSHPPPVIHVPPPPRTSPPSRKPAPPPSPPPAEPEVDTNKIYLQGSNGITLNKVYVILWDFEAQDTDEVTLSRGDLVFVNEPNESSDWWFGEVLDNDAMMKMGKKGLFPRQYSDLAFETVQT